MNRKEWYEKGHIQQSKKRNKCVADSKKHGATHLSFCAGYDGLGLGLELAGIHISKAIYVEREVYAAANLVAKIERGLLAPGFVHTDLTSFPYRKFRGLIDIFSGGFPCQVVSSEGHRKADEDERHLFPYFLTAIKEIQPTFLLFENVDGISTAKINNATTYCKAGTPFLQYVLTELEQLGYVTTAVPATAREVGANHARTRWFIIGVLNTKSQRLLRDEVDSKESTKQINNKTHTGNPYRSPIIRSLRKHIFPCKKQDSKGCEEASRVIKTDEIILSTSKDSRGRVPSEHKMDRAVYGATDRMAYDRLATSPADEMRMAGNGVVPKQVARAFQLGLKECYRRM